MSGLAFLLLLALFFLASLAMVGRHALMILPFALVTMYWLWSRGARDDYDD